MVLGGMVVELEWFLCADDGTGVVLWSIVTQVWCLGGAVEYYSGSGLFWWCGGCLGGVVEYYSGSGVFGWCGGGGSVWIAVPTVATRVGCYYNDK